MGALVLFLIIFTMVAAIVSAMTTTAVQARKPPVRLLPHLHLHPSSLLPTAGLPLTWEGEHHQHQHQHQQSGREAEKAGPPFRTYVCQVEHCNHTEHKDPIYRLWDELVCDNFYGDSDVMAGCKWCGRKIAGNCGGGGGEADDGVSVSSSVAPLPNLPAAAPRDVAECMATHVAECREVPPELRDRVLIMHRSLADPLAMDVHVGGGLRAGGVRAHPDGHAVWREHWRDQERSMKERLAERRKRDRHVKFVLDGEAQLEF